MSNRNRTSGNTYELKIVHELKDMGYHVSTSRNESRTMDAKKVDIVGDFPFHVQCKNTTTRPDYNTILNEMPDDKPNLIFHKLTAKANTKFITQGEFVIMKKETFYNLIKWIMAKTSSNNSAVEVLGLLGIAFIILKLYGVIKWSWWIVLLPFWGGLILVLIIILLVLLFIK